MPAKNIIIANPQGKASISTLNDLDEFQPSNIKAKDIPQWLADYFTSLLVLSAKFNFKPVINKHYYLYTQNNEWKLSLIEPQSWENCPYTYFGMCILHEDRSWSIQAKDYWQDDVKLKAMVISMRKEFLNSINTDLPIIDLLPYFSSQLSYYQRITANSLARSLKQSLQLKLGIEASNRTSGKSMIRNLKETDTMLLKLFE